MRLVIALFFLIAFNAISAERAVTFTFLKAKAGQHAHLATFIEKNWFAMDKIAVEQGLFESYTLLRNSEHGEDWDFIVQVTYTDERGYEGVKKAFEIIRSKHQTIKIDNKTFSELGQVTKSWNTIEIVEH